LEAGTILTLIFGILGVLFTVAKFLSWIWEEYKSNSQQKAEIIAKAIETKASVNKILDDVKHNQERIEELSSINIIVGQNTTDIVEHRAIIKDFEKFKNEQIIINKILDDKIELKPTRWNNGDQ
jgi:3-dehydroquinate synthase class II